MKYTIVVTTTFSTSWLALSREERHAIEAPLTSIVSKHADKVQARFFDAEAFEASFSDFIIFETTDLPAYYFLIEELRDSQIIARGFLTINNIFMGIENGYQTYEKTLADKEPL